MVVTEQGIYKDLTIVANRVHVPIAGQSISVIRQCVYYYMHACVYRGTWGQPAPIARKLSIKKEVVLLISNDFFFFKKKTPPSCFTL